MKYKIVESQNRYDLVEKVNDSIAEGWKPQGGVNMLYHSGYKESWAQAMVKP
jgi:hypothetical protein